MSDTAPAPPSELNDRDLVAEYVASEGEPGDPRTEALIEEIQRRNLDI